MAFQLPCFLALIYGIAGAKPWARILAIVYATHAATTLVPILSDILYGPSAGPHSAKVGKALFASLTVHASW